MIIGIDASRAFIGDKTGTENYSYHLVNHLLQLPESRAHVFVLFIRPNTIIPSELVGYSNVLVKVVKWRYLWTQLGLAWETWFGLRLDVLWVPAHTLPILRNPKIKTVVTIHGLEYQWLPEYKNWLQKWYLPLSTMYAARAADKLIAVSHFTQKQLEKELHTNPKKIKVIHEGVRLSSRLAGPAGFRGVMKKFGIEQKKYILFVGSVQPRKNLAVLIEAFSHFASGYAGDTAQIKLVISGGIGWMAEEVLRSPGRYGVEEKVVFTGRVSDLDLQILYQGALLYVQPSFTEGFGLPVLEAMAYKVPVIVSDGGALPEVAGQAGIVVPLDLRFVMGFAGAMAKVAGGVKLRSKMVAMGSARVKEFSWTKAARETLKVLITTGR